MAQAARERSPNVARRSTKSPPKTVAKLKIICACDTWTSFTLDPDTGELFVPVGNPSPAFALNLGPGDNLYIGSIVVLDAKTAAYKRERHFELKPGDWHDWDVSNPLVLIRPRGQGPDGRRAKGRAPLRLDRASNKLLYRAPVTRTECRGALRRR